MAVTLTTSSVFSTDRSEIEAIQHRVHMAENTADTGLLEGLITHDAICLNSEGPPIVGDLAIQSLFEFIFNS